MNNEPNNVVCAFCPACSHPIAHHSHLNGCESGVFHPESPCPCELKPHQLEGAWARNPAEERARTDALAEIKAALDSTRLMALAGREIDVSTDALKVVRIREIIEGCIREISAAQRGGDG